MTTTHTISEQEVRSMAEAWYQKLDVHAPVAELLPLLSEDDLSMVFPEGTLQGVPAFVDWYEGVIRKFFDEVHVLREVSVRPGSQPLQVHVVVNWQARTWNPPAATSKFTNYDAYQTWQVKRSRASGRVVISKYVVDELRPLEGTPPF